MKTIIFLSIFLFGSGLNNSYFAWYTQTSNSLGSKIYYINNKEGNDNSSGLSEEEAWSSLEKVNSFTFQPGDKILFKAGESWTGYLHPKGSGTTESPIIIDQYGEGDKPLFDGAGITNKGVLYLENQSGWEINNLEIVNDAAEGDIRRGVEICGRNGGVLSHIYLKNLHVHNIKGIIGNDMLSKSTGGIFFSVYADDVTSTRFDDVLIESCEINNCDNQGIVTSGKTTYPDPSSSTWQNKKFTNFVVRKNTIYNISKNAMILRLLDGGLIEHNLCYATATGTTGNTIFTRSSRRVILQYNEGYDNQSPSHDGCLYDADLESVECIFQYSYSHDNAHGLYWQCTVQEDYGNVVRYNISQNDKGRIFNFSYPSNGTEVYNNTVYIGEHRSPIIIGEKTLNSGKRNYSFRNNIIYNNSENASYIWVGDEYIGKRDFSNNCFYGFHPGGEPEDLYKIITDPSLINPGEAKDINDLDGYMLLPESPCINKGANTSFIDGTDFFGQPLYNGLPDIGANEFYELESALSFNTQNESRILIYPNPCKEEVMLNFYLDKNSTVRFDFYNIQGNLVKSSEPEYMDQGNISKQINLPDDFPPGFYHCRIMTSSRLFETKGVIVL